MWITLKISCNCAAIILQSALFSITYGYAIVLYDMDIIRTILPYVQIILSILLVAAILLQQRGSSLGGAFGGDNFSATFHKRRGAELFLFRLSIVLAILFALSAFVTLVV